MYLAIDTETGGIDPNKTSLLTAFFAVVDEKFNVIDTLDIALKSDVYQVTAEALSINKINLIDHHAVAEDEATVTNKLNQFLKKHSVKIFLQGHAITTIPLIPLGHNINFDLVGLKTRLPGVSWNKYVSYRVLDTQVVGRFLQLIGKIPSDNKCSLRDLAKNFGIEDNAAHTAEGDVQVTLQVFKALMETGANTNVTKCKGGVC